MDKCDDDGLAEVRAEMTPEQRLLLAMYEAEAPPDEVRERVRTLYRERSSET